MSSASEDSGGDSTDLSTIQVMTSRLWDLGHIIQVNAVTATARMVDSSVDVAVTTTAREAHHPRGPFDDETVNAWFNELCRARAQGRVGTNCQWGDGPTGQPTGLPTRRRRASRPASASIDKQQSTTLRRQA